VQRHRAGRHLPPVVANRAQDRLGAFGRGGN
jgi:hypothetical protein